MKKVSKYFANSIKKLSLQNNNLKMIKLCFIQDITVAYLAERSSLSPME